MLNLSPAFFKELWETNNLARFLKQLDLLTPPIPPIQLPPGVGPDPLPFENEPHPQPSLEASVDDFILPERFGSNNPGLIPDLMSNLMPDVSNSFVNEIVTTEVPIDVPTVFADSDNFLL